MDEDKKRQRPVIAYYIVIILAVILLNYFVFPEIGERKTEEVDYGTFLDMIEAGGLAEVEIQTDYILFKTKDDDAETIYKTGIIEDPQLVARLHEADVKFTRVVPRDYSALFAFLFTWILPLVLLVFIGRFFLCRARGNIDNALTFTKRSSRI